MRLIWVTNSDINPFRCHLQGYDDAAEESPSLADLSSNNLTPESTRKKDGCGGRQKKAVALHRRKDKKAKKVMMTNERVFSAHM